MLVSFLPRATWLAVLLPGLLACASKPTPLPAPGPDFSRYVALGTSFTAGTMAGGLTRAGQLASYPNLLAGQMRQAGGGAFAQPLFSEAEANGTGYLRLSSLTPFRLSLVTEKRAIRSTNPLLYTKWSGSNQNLGVPGLRSTDLAKPGYGSTLGNPYFERLLPPGSEQKTYLSYLAESKPTFFTNWVGTHDVFDFVASGGLQPLTDPADFSKNYHQLVETLAATGAKGVVANLPDPTLSPLLVLPSVLAQFRNDKVGYWITTGKGEVRLATDADFILITADSIGFFNPAGFSKGFFKPAPLHNDDVLDADEAARARAAVLAFNASIAAEAQARNWPLLDVAALFVRLKTGFSEDGVRLETDFLKDGQLTTTSVFSIDGLHPNPRGYALLANEFIRVINANYQTNLVRLDLSQFEGFKPQ